jgi:hypothetical protein
VRRVSSPPTFTPTSPGLEVLHHVLVARVVADEHDGRGRSRSRRNRTAPFFDVRRTATSSTMCRGGP